MVIVQSAVSTFNVQASINAWMMAHLATMPLPAWLQSAQPGVVTEAGDIAANLPTFALYHIPSMLAGADYQGGYVGDGMSGGDAIGLMEVSAYASNNDPQATALLRIMRDWVAALCVAEKVVEVLDYFSDLYTPPASGYKIDIGDLTDVETQADPNPDILRARMLIAYSYTFRASAQA